MPMSMPELPQPNPDMTQEQALTMILSSIALEEAALSHIINAEGEKIQHMLKQIHCDQCSDFQNILAVNQSVTRLLEMVLQNQMILKNKMEKVLEHLPKPPTPPAPPCPPMPPRLPYPPLCPPGKPNTSCFCVIPRIYRCGEPLLWMMQCTSGHFAVHPEDCSKIQLPPAGSFKVDFCAEACGCKCPSGGVELVVACGDQTILRKQILPTACRGEWVLSAQCTLSIPCSCCPCHASVFVSASGGINIRQGWMCFSRQGDCPSSTLQNHPDSLGY